MRYLGINPRRPRIGVFDFTGCEGCELQLANKESTLPAFLDAIEIVSFREISSDVGDSYEIALIEGAITREDEVERLRAIRDRAQLVVALGSCACFGGVNRMKNAYNLEDANRKVYGDTPKETLPTRSIGEVVKVDLFIPGCPISKDEVERIVQHLVLDVPYNTPKYPICVECKQRFTSCVFDAWELCLGPITRAGCGAPCPSAGIGCYGCRGATTEPNFEEFLNVASERGFAEIEVRERMDFFGGFEVLR